MINRTLIISFKKKQHMCSSTFYHFEIFQYRYLILLNYHSKYVEDFPANIHPFSSQSAIVILRTDR